MAGESSFQTKLINRIQEAFPKAIVIKPDSEFLDSFPDRVILCGQSWAAIEMKRSKTAHQRANQAYYVTVLNEMSYASFAYPQNEEEVFDGVARHFEATKGCPRISFSVKPSLA